MVILVILLCLSVVASVIILVKSKHDDTKETEKAERIAEQKKPIAMQPIEYQGESLYRYSATGGRKLCGACGCENTSKASACSLCGEKL